MKRIEIKKLDKDGFFGIRKHWVDHEDVEVIINGDTYLVPKGRKPHKVMPWKSKFGPDSDFEMAMYKVPVLAREENQMELFK